MPAPVAFVLADEGVHVSVADEGVRVPAADEGVHAPPLPIAVVREDVSENDALRTGGFGVSDRR